MQDTVHPQLSKPRLEVFIQMSILTRTEGLLWVLDQDR